MSFSLHLVETVLMSAIVMLHFPTFLCQRLNYLTNWSALMELFGFLVYKFTAVLTADCGKKPGIISNAHSSPNYPVVGISAVKLRHAFPWQTTSPGTAVVLAAGCCSCSFCFRCGLHSYTTDKTFFANSSARAYQDWSTIQMWRALTSPYNNVSYGCSLFFAIACSSEIER